MPTTAPTDVVWRSLVEVLRHRLSDSGSFARLLGCTPAHGTAEFDGRVNQTLPGFRVAESEQGRRMVLRGRHRFADYALVFLLDGETLCARTFAAFPGMTGRIYRAAVIGSGAHSLVTKKLLRAVTRAAGE